MYQSTFLSLGSLYSRRSSDHQIDYILPKAFIDSLLSQSSNIVRKFTHFYYIVFCFRTTLIPTLQSRPDLLLDRHADIRDLQWVPAVGICAQSPSRHHIHSALRHSYTGTYLENARSQNVVLPSFCRGWHM